jgi:nuclear transport factor 2 (NTF2) superfamily protein
MFLWNSVNHLPDHMVYNRTTLWREGKTFKKHHKQMESTSTEKWAKVAPVRSLVLYQTNFSHKK